MEHDLEGATVSDAFDNEPEIATGHCRRNPRDDACFAETARGPG